MLDRYIRTWLDTHRFRVRGDGELLVADQGGGIIDWATADTLIAFRSRKPAKFAASLPVLSAPMSGERSGA